MNRVRTQTRGMRRGHYRPHKASVLRGYQSNQRNLDRLPGRGGFPGEARQGEQQSSCVIWWEEVAWRSRHLGSSARTTKTLDLFLPL